jgi:hypothetical protein
MKDKDYGNWYLDLEKVSSFEIDYRREIISMYRDYLHFSDDGRTNLARGLFNTLSKGGLLVNVVDTERIEKIKFLSNENN